MKILDSDHCVALLRGNLDLRGQAAPTEKLGVTAISVGELVHGVHKSARAAENLARLDVLLAALTVLPYDEGAAHQFGLLKARLEQDGMRLSDLGLQIASISLQHQAPLITHNQQHFERVPDLALEDWLA
jgi:tRNA(fMet)-specific endonuclease VapC